MTPILLNLNEDVCMFLVPSIRILQVTPNETDLLGFLSDPFRIQN